ncbi:MAG TPA: ABC transporter ATP-binding protein [Xanthobacteraceae bacterium]|nr:ABC transporter ATP-binding protein [Xanthobacteraceae bacterium]
MTAPLLTVRGLHAGYGSIRVLHGIGFDVEDGAIIALLGANGAGKTTTLRALSGMIPSRGQIELDGRDIGTLSPAERTRLGIAHVPQGRGTFVDFTVDENLALGAYLVRDKRKIRKTIDEWYGVFPWLAARRDQLAGSLSGGEQQMLAIARALMAEPRILMCDEPSLGLAPAITQSLFALLERLNKERSMAILLVEQNARLTLKVAHRAYVIESGEIQLEGEAAQLRDNPLIQRAYLGT